MKKTILAVIIVLSVLALVASAKEYVSFNGGFYITYPDSWTQIDYNTVDLFLSRNDADPSAYQYEAVLAEKADKFFTGDYLIIRVDSIDQMSVRRRDSVLNYYSLMYEQPVNYKAMDEIIKNIQPEIPYHDAATNSTVIYRPISVPDGDDKFNLIFFRFTDYGLVKFFFFSLNDQFETKKIEFSEIFNSFSTEDIQSKAKEENIKIADIKTEQGSEQKPGEGSTYYWPALITVLVILVFIVLLRRRKK